MGQNPTRKVTEYHIDYPNWWVELPEEVRDDLIVRACYHAMMRYPGHFPGYDEAECLKHMLIEVVKDKRVMQVQLNRLAQLQPPAPIVLTKSAALKVQQAIMQNEIEGLRVKLAEATAKAAFWKWWQRPRCLWSLWERWRYGP